jgi:hypothetical protein
MEKTESMSNKNHRLALRLCTVIAFTGLGLFTGCQSQIGGQTLPSPHYLTDDVQYFAPTSQMKLQKEAAVMQEYNAQRKQNSN